MLQLVQMHPREEKIPAHLQQELGRRAVHIVGAVGVDEWRSPERRDDGIVLVHLWLRRLVQKPVDHVRMRALVGQRLLITERRTQLVIGLW